MSIRHRLESELKDLRAEVGSLAIRVAECSQRIGKIESQLAEIEDYELVDSASVAPSFDSASVDLRWLLQLRAPPPPQSI